MHINLTRRSPKQWAGFTLLEVLVALFVLSIGLLGLAALQSLGLKFNHQSYQRTQATFQAYDILDRIRANPVAKNGALYSSVAVGDIPSDPACGTTCTPQQLRDLDIRIWNSNNASLLTQGKGGIETTGSISTITITWVENDLPMSLVVEAQP